MFNSVKAVEHHMYVEQQTAEAAYVRVHVPDRTASTKKKAHLKWKCCLPQPGNPVVLRVMAPKQANDA